MSSTSGSDVLVVVGRPTFDLSSAAPIIHAALAVIDPSTRVVASGDVLQTPSEVVTAFADQRRSARRLIVVFASFADSRLASAAVDHFDSVDEIVLWSFPEEWTGGRLRRNSLCGANLAAHHLVSGGRIVAGLHALPGDDTVHQLDRAVTRALARRNRHDVPDRPALSQDEEDRVRSAIDSLRSTRLGVVGKAPDGFEACEADLLPDGVDAAHYDLQTLFDEASRPLSFAGEGVVSELRDLAGNESVAREAVRRSVALQQGARRLAQRHDRNALAIRCWPECFDESQGAACAAMACLNELGLPAACEADALGAISMRLMSSLSGEPTFLADLVEVDADRDCIALWHCGVAPRTMATAMAEVQVGLHPNRQQPLVFDFALAEAPATLFRVSKAGGRLSFAIAEGHLTGERPFSGTAGVVQVDGSARALVETLIEEGLEHHVVVARGHHARSLRAIAHDLALPVVPLS